MLVEVLLRKAAINDEHSAQVAPTLIADVPFRNE
jgi:hypothetical protein